MRKTTHAHTSVPCALLFSMQLAILLLPILKAQNSGEMHWLPTVTRNRRLLRSASILHPAVGVALSFASCDFCLGNSSRILRVNLAWCRLVIKPFVWLSYSNLFGLLCCRLKGYMDMKASEPHPNHAVSYWATQNDALACSSVSPPAVPDCDTN